MWAARGLVACGVGDVCLLTCFFFVRVSLTFACWRLNFPRLLLSSFGDECDYVLVDTRPLYVLYLVSFSDRLPCFMCARVSAQDGKTALDYAKEKGTHDVARLIEVRFAPTRVADIYCAQSLMPQCVCVFVGAKIAHAVMRMCFVG